ncbi:unnamed protein product [Wuchereria bancrofti]|uniref:Galactosylgalactosylxylosylprotein 3-beta-glucuronosyltransferase n=1 Tax=Wuchereria bancrofti TaxID=6293 RepID=A0A3P7DKL2_WUCBA|nr:unnamed protein product [Wuchereria bancrofti]
MNVFHNPVVFDTTQRLSQTLMHISQLIWIVVEDATHISLPVKQLLDRSGLEYYYLAVKRRPRIPGV